MWIMTSGISRGLYLRNLGTGHGQWKWLTLGYYRWRWVSWFSLILLWSWKGTTSYRLLYLGRICCCYERIIKSDIKIGNVVHWGVTVQSAAMQMNGAPTTYSNNKCQWEHDQILIQARHWQTQAIKHMFIQQVTTCNISTAKIVSSQRLLLNRGI